MLDTFDVKSETVFILDALGVKAKSSSFLTPWC